MTEGKNMPPVNGCWKSISIYKKILSADDCESIPFMFYDDAVSNGYLEEYLKGEEKFTAWLCFLFESEGRVAKCNEKLLSVGDFKRLILLGLRERKLSVIEFPKSCFLIKFGFDQTHDVFSINAQKLQEIVDIAVRFGLHDIATIRYE